MLFQVQPSFEESVGEVAAIILAVALVVGVAIAIIKFIPKGRDKE